MRFQELEAEWDDDNASTSQGTEWNPRKSKRLCMRTATRLVEASMNLGGAVATWSKRDCGEVDATRRRPFETGAPRAEQGSYGIRTSGETGSGAARGTQVAVKVTSGDWISERLETGTDLGTVRLITAMSLVRRGPKWEDVDSNSLMKQIFHPFTSALRGLFRRWGALLILIVLYVAMLGAIYEFFVTREATVGQLILSLLLALAAPVLFLIIQTMAARYNQGSNGAWSIARMLASRLLEAVCDFASAYCDRRAGCLSSRQGRNNGAGGDGPRRRACASCSPAACRPEATGS